MVRPKGALSVRCCFVLWLMMFENLDSEMGISLFADGAIWKRGGNLEFIVKKLQEATTEIEGWSFKWGFKVLVDKTKTMFFTRKMSRPNEDLDPNCMTQNEVQKKCLY